LQINANLLQRNVNNLTIIAIFVGGMNIRRWCMNIQTEAKRKQKDKEREGEGGVTKVKIFNTSGRSRISKKRTNFVCYM